MYRLQNEQESFARYKILGAVASKAERFLDGKALHALDAAGFRTLARYPPTARTL